MRGKLAIARNGIWLASMIAFLVAVPSVAQAQNPNTRWIQGWLTASQITATGADSVGVWEKKLNCPTENDCARKLVGTGDKYVLVKDKDVYQLDYKPGDQKLVAEYAGTSANIQGVLNYQKKTIEIDDIQSAYSEWMSGYVTASQIAVTGTSDIGIWRKKLNCTDESDCAQKLVGAGDKYVLVIGNDVYQLSDQKRAAPHVGMSVMVKGILNHKKKTIDVEDIEDILDCG